MNQQQKRKYRRYLTLAIVLDLGFLTWAFFREMDQRIPDEIRVAQSEERELGSLYEEPFVTFSEAIPVSGNGGYQIPCYLLGVVPFKNIKVTPAEEEEVYVSGATIGVYLETDGVLIVDTGEIIAESGMRQDPARNLVQSGDYIVAFNQQPVSNKKELMKDLLELNGEEVTLSIRREKETIPVSLTPVKDAKGEYKLGIWVRDDTQGIGTMTFVDEKGNFGALGHGISDVDTGDLLNIHKGGLYDAQVLGIVKGSRGKPGELSGLIRYDQNHLLGQIRKNTGIGIFGNLGEKDVERLSLRKMPVAYKQELSTGPAIILSCIHDKVEEFEAEIIRIDYNQEDSNKSFIIKVTDERLIGETGGIVQGMSGSPIIQNGKFVGAVTHVFIQDSASGYGIFAETMLEQVH